MSLRCEFNSFIIHNSKWCMTCLLRPVELFKFVMKASCFPLMGWLVKCVHVSRNDTDILHAHVLLQPINESGRYHKAHGHRTSNLSLFQSALESITRAFLFRFADPPLYIFHFHSPRYIYPMSLIAPRRRSSIKAPVIPVV